MNNPSDVEEALATMQNSFRLGVSEHSGLYSSNSGSQDRTSKSHSVVFNVETSVLELIAANEDEESHVSDEGYRDPLLGPCCDLVRGVIYTDIFYIIKNINVIITVLLGFTILDPDDYDLRLYQDDVIQREVDRLDALFWILISFYLCGIFFASVGIYGASRFSKYWVLATTIWIFVDILCGAILTRYGGMIIVMFFVYPHVALFLALHKGKITRENYADNKYCCCACCIKDNSSSMVESNGNDQQRRSTITSSEKSCATTSDYKESGEITMTQLTTSDGVTAEAVHSITARTA